MDRYCISCGKITAKHNDRLYMCQAGHENWISPAAGASVYVIKDGKVLFGVRSRDPGKGKLDIPGGFIEPHESAEQAANREAKEELGIDVVITNYLGSYPSVYNGRPALNIVFIAEMTEQRIAASDDMGGGEPVWKEIEDLPSADEIMDVWMVQAQADLLEWFRTH